MTMAEQIKEKESSDYSAKINEAEFWAGWIDQEYQQETTTYTFSDGSILQDCNGELSCYHS